MEILDILEEREDEAIINCLMSLVDQHNIDSICDYGCGDGRILKKIKITLPSGIRYTGIDFWSNEYSKHIMPENEECINFIDNGSPEIDEFIEHNHYGLVFHRLLCIISDYRLKNLSVLNVWLHGKDFLF